MSSTKDIINRFLGEPLKNIAHSLYDGYVETNVKFRTRSGMKTFIIRRDLSKCCEWCRSLAGIYEYGKEPKEVYQRHDSCRCMVTFRNEEGKYKDVWSKKEHLTQRAARINRVKEIEKEQNVYFSKMKKETSWGGSPKQNTKEQLLELKDFALEKGIILGQEFMTFDGDIDLAKDFIETVSENRRGRIFLRKNKVKINVSYTMTDDTFAQSAGSKITINGFAYRDRELLEEAYAKKVAEGWFPQGSTYLDIATHESAHLIVYMEQLKTKDVTMHVFGRDEIQASMDIIEHISEYASINNKELIAEAYVAYKNGSNDGYVLKTLKYTGIIR